MGAEFHRDAINCSIESRVESILNEKRFPGCKPRYRREKASIRLLKVLESRLLEGPRLLVRRSTRVSVLKFLKTRSNLSVHNI